MSTNNDILPKIETILKNESRTFDCSFYDTISNAFEALQAFVIDSYSLSSNEQFSIQYKDDDNDFVTIASIEDFQEAIEETNGANEILKVYVTLQKKDVISKGLNVNEPKTEEKMPVDNKQEEINKEKKENNKEKKENDNQKYTKDILNDLRNNKLFREEMISFIKTALILFQQNNTNADYDVATCIMTALSSHEMLMEHEALQRYITILLPFIASKIQPFAFFLMNIDANMITVWINQMLDGWGNNMQQAMPFSPLLNIMNGILQIPSTNPSTTEEKNNEEKKQPSKQATTDTQPIIGSTITDDFSYFKNQQRNHSNNNDGSHSTKPSFNIGSLLTTLLTPPQTNSNNNSDININTNINNNNVKPNDESSKPSDDDFKLCVVKDDITLSDGAVVLPNQILIKTWQVKNIGRKEIANGLYIKYVGDVFNSMINGVQFPIIIHSNTLSVNQETQVCVTIETPKQDGHYSSQWKIFDAQGKPFDLLLTINITVVSENDQYEIKNNAFNEQTNNDNIEEFNDFELISNIENENENENEKKKAIEKEKENENMNKIENDQNKENNINGPYSEQIQLLLDMGFTNVEMLRSLLTSHNGLIDDVVNVLSS